MEDRVMSAFDDSAEILRSFARKNINKIIDLAGLISDAFEGGNKLIIFGNGGSAADAQHMAAEFINRFQIERPPLPAMALTTDTSILTSIGNDYDFSDIFAKQLKALGKNGDIALGISTSGNSLNVLKAFEAASSIGIKTVGLTGKDGGKMAGVADILLNVDSGSTPRIQETHITTCHVICDLVDHRLFGTAK